jgi:hypothetical protein
MADKDRRIEYIKHLNTLSTGAIVLLATFLEKLFQQPRQKYLAIWAIIGFLVSVITAVVAYTFEVVFREATLEKRVVRVIDGAITAAMWLGFLAGVSALGAFAIVNLR